MAQRGGAASGKVVVGSKEVMVGLRAAVSGLARKDGAGAIPASALRVRYALPLSPLSDLVAGSMVERDLDRIFAHRRRRLEDLLT